MANKYILDEGRPILMNDLFMWGKWFEDSGEERLVKQTQVGPFHVATYFTGIDYRMEDDAGEPLLWETSVVPSMGDVIEPHTNRYTSREEAKTLHDAWVNCALEAARVKTPNVEAVAYDDEGAKK